MIAALEKCQKSLTEYLRNKRTVFPRFNFISDDELLNILGSGKPAAIQEHVGKMFDNLDKFKFVTNITDRVVVQVVTALISCEKEIMEFRNPVSTEDNVEIWMGLVLEEMKRSNRYLTKKAVYDYGKVCNMLSRTIDAHFGHYFCFEFSDNSCFSVYPFLQKFFLLS